VLIGSTADRVHFTAIDCPPYARFTAAYDAAHRGQVVDRITAERAVSKRRGRRTTHDLRLPRFNPPPGGARQDDPRCVTVSPFLPSTEVTTP